MEYIIKMKKTWKIYYSCFQLSWRASEIYTCLRAFLKIVNTVIPFAVAWNTKCIVELLSLSDKSEGTYKKWILCMFLMLGIAILKIIFQKVEAYISRMHDASFINYIEQIMAEKALEMEMMYFDNPKNYDVFEIVKKDIYSLIAVIWDGTAFFGNLITVFVCISILMPTVPSYIMILILVIIPSAVVENKYTKKIYLCEMENQTEERKLSYLYYLATNKKYAQEFRLYSLGDYLMEKYKRLWNCIFERKRKIEKERVAWGVLLAVVPEIVSVLVLIRIGNNVFNRKYSMGDYVFYSGILLQLTSVLFLSIQSFIQLYEKKLKVERFFDFINCKLNGIQSGKKRIKDIMTVEFCNVSFTYPGNSGKVLDCVSFSIRKGEKICIVGENGAGKSTLLKLLLRFYEIQEGSIRINGFPIQEYDIMDLRKNFACYFQNTENYAFTLRENIELSQVEQPDYEKLKYAIKMAGLEYIINSLEMGIDTNLTRMYDEKGMELSIGQNQKVAIARTFYRNSTFLILDEPSSSLDPKSEYNLFQAIKDSCVNQTVLFISHRFTSVKLANRILVFENGKKIGDGSHKKLMRDCAVYSKLFHYQADKFIEE